jgi:hypothetical protein
MQRTYTHNDALHMVPKYWHIEEQMCNPDAPLQKRRHEKLCDVWHKVRTATAHACHTMLASPAAFTNAQALFNSPSALGKSLQWQ